MERLKLRFIGNDHSMGLRKNEVYILCGKISDGYICLEIDGYEVPYTINGFMANWEIVKKGGRNDRISCFNKYNIR